MKIKMLKCPICQRHVKTYIHKENYHFQNGFVCDLQTCSFCKAYYITPFSLNAAVHEELHKSGHGGYARLKQIGKKCESFYKHNATKTYRNFLSENNKYRFVIDFVEKNCNKNQNILEIGCAEGYLTGYFILQQYNIVGIDISPSAIEFCSRTYGPHFYCGDLKDFYTQKYDMIYHLGLIGVLDYPKQFLNLCIDMLNDNGVLLFNAPNKWRVESDWTDTTPPDLRCLFDVTTFSKIIQRKDVSVQIKIGISGKLYDYHELTKLKYLQIKDRYLKKDGQYNIYVVIRKGKPA